jgi:prepilin-type N-terminal cleavage/methylation domain-containing protein
MNKNKGFTLIELLVVIAIIGILSSVVLASLSSARNKGKDAAVKSQLASMRAQAEIFYSAADTYDTICTTASTSNGFGGTAGLLIATQNSAGLATTIVSDIATIGEWDHITCHATADAWAVDAPMTASTAAVPSMYCVDSTGASKVEAAPMLENAVACL